MATGLDYVTDALREIGVLAAGQTPSAEDADDGLTALNDFIDLYFFCIASMIAPAFESCA